MTMFRYSVRYVRAEPWTDIHRVYRVHVTARNADDARRMAAIADPLFAATTETPRRVGKVEVVA